MEEDFWNSEWGNFDEDVEPTTEAIQQIDEDEEWLKSIQYVEDEEEDEYAELRADPYLADWIPLSVPKTKPVATTNVAQYAKDYLVGKGLPTHVAAGIVGNLVKESNLNPNISEKGNTGNGRGIAQWDVRNRWKDLQNFASKDGRNYADVDTQLDFLLHEANQRGDLQKTMQAKTPEEAAMIFGKTYERPNEKFADWEGRMSTAKSLNMQYGGINKARYGVDNIPKLEGVSDEALLAYFEEEGIDVESYQPYEDQQVEVNEQSGFQKAANIGLQAVDKFNQVKSKLNSIGAGAAKSVSDAIDIQSEMAGSQRDASSMRKFNEQKNRKKYSISKSPLNQPLIYT